MRILVFHVEVDFPGFPFVAGFGQKGGDQAQEGGFIGEDAGHAGAAFEFLVDAFQRIGGAQPILVGGGKGSGFTSTDHQGKSLNLQVIHNTIINTGDAFKGESGQ